MYGKKRLCKECILFLIGGSLYIVIELVFRFFAGTLPTHWSMAILGGVVFVLLGAINEVFSWEMPLALQALIGAVVATAAEFTAGLILNVWLRLGIWDYSKLPFQFMGQIALPFFLAWLGLALAAILLDDWLRYRLFGEEYRRYRIF